MNISGIIYESIVDGSGVRTTIFISGCKHNCYGCQNPKLHSFTNGKEFTIDLQKQIINDIKSNPLIKGITLSGGDPFFSSTEVLSFVKLIKEKLPLIDIWIYSGFTYEEIIQNDDMKSLLKECNILVDGKFILEKRDITLQFKGSSNQRIINIQETLRKGEIILWQ
jgi:anaerobic ribonucleoside-triphosphate reductase activating protein